MTGSDPVLPRYEARWRAPSPGRRIGLAVLTGAISKILSLAVQVVAVAIAVRALRADGFAMFVTVASLVSWINLASLGVAPGLTIGIARAAAAFDRVGEARLFVVSMTLMVGVATCLLLTTAVLAQTGLISRGLEEWLKSDGADGPVALVLMVSVIAAQLILAVPEAAQLGYQSQFVTNLWSGIGSVASLILLVTIGPSIGSVTAFVFISQVPQVLARTLNGLSLIGSRPYLLRPDRIPIRSMIRPVLGTGAAFAGIQLAGYFALQFGVLVLAATSTTESIALGGVILRGITLASGAVLLVTTPTWPALTDAVERGDRRWAMHIYRRMPVAALLYASLVGIGILVASEWAIEVWTGSAVLIRPELRIILAGYFVLGVWSHVNAVLLVGLGAIRPTSMVLLLEAATIAALQVVLVPSLGVTGYVGALLVGTLLVSAWVLPIRVRREILRIGLVSRA